MGVWGATPRSCRIFVILRLKNGLSLKLMQETWKMLKPGMSIYILQHFPRISENMIFSRGARPPLELPMSVTHANISYISNVGNSGYI